MAKALKCDRCGQFYDRLKDFRKYRIQEMSSPISDVDLCPDCYETFTKWLTGEKLQSDSVRTGELYPGEVEIMRSELQSGVEALFEEDSE